MSLEKSIKVLNLLDSNKTDIVKDVFIIPTDDLQKKNTWSRKSADTVKTSWNFEKKIRILFPDKF